MTAAVLERSRPSAQYRSSAARSSSVRSTRSSAARAENLRVEAGRSERRRPKLKVIDRRATRQRARRRNALLVLFVVVLLGFFAVAFVHAQLVSGQQDLDAIRSRIAEAEAHNAKVGRAVEEASSPQIIVGRATELGMVRAYQPVYLQAVSPLRDVPAVVAIAPSSAAEGIDLVASPGIAVGISSDATVTSVVPSQETGELATGAPAVVAADSLESPDLSGSAVSAGSADLTAEPDQPMVVTAPVAESVPVGAAATTGGASLGGISVNSTSSSAVATPATQPSGATVSGASVGTATAPAASISQTPSSIAGSRAVSAGSGAAGGGSGSG